VDVETIVAVASMDVGENVGEDVVFVVGCPRATTQKAQQAQDRLLL